MKQQLRFLPLCVLDGPTFPPALSATSYLINKPLSFFRAVKCLNLKQQLFIFYEYIHVWVVLWGGMLFTGICRFHSLIFPVFSSHPH